MMSKESVVPEINMAALLGSPETNPEKTTPLEKVLQKVTPEDAAAETASEVKFQFRDLLDAQQLVDLKANAPVVAAKMIDDYNSIIQFGSPVLVKLNDIGVQLLEAQKDIKIPEAEIIVNDLLREVDGYSAKFRNAQMEDVFNKVKSFFKGVKYSLTSMVRESQPIVKKLADAEVKLKEMENHLADNVTRGKKLHTGTTKILEEVVAVLAALEEIIEVAKKDFTEIDEAVREAETLENADNPIVKVEFKGKNVSLNDLRNLHTLYANGISELEKTWFDWRQQFFLGYAQAPSTMNLILVSSTMQRRCQVFRTMGLPSARIALASWQQAALAKEGAAMGTAVQEGTNKLIQGAFTATGEAVRETAMASQTPVVSEETIWAIVDSIKTQCEGLVAADKWGREQRTRNLKAMEDGERAIKTEFTQSRRALVMNAVQATQAPTELAPTPDVDILKKIGVS